MSSYCAGVKREAMWREKPESLLESGVDTEEKSGTFNYDIDCDECEEIDIGKSNEKELCCSMAEPSDSTVNNISSSSSSDV